MTCATEFYHNYGFLNTFVPLRLRGLIYYPHRNRGLVFYPHRVSEIFCFILTASPRFTFLSSPRFSLLPSPHLRGLVFYPRPIHPHEVSLFSLIQHYLTLSFQFFSAPINNLHIVVFIVFPTPFIH